LIIGARKNEMDSKLFCIRCKAAQVIEFHHKDRDDCDLLPRTTAMPDKISGPHSHYYCQGCMYDYIISIGKDLKR
jgi:hypothetical protein